jgi:hypothetical protein
MQVHLIIQCGLLLLVLCAYHLLCASAAESASHRSLCNRRRCSCHAAGRMSDQLHLLCPSYLIVVNSPCSTHTPCWSLVSLGHAHACLDSTACSNLPPTMSDTPAPLPPPSYLPYPPPTPGVVLPSRRFRGVFLPLPQHVPGTSRHVAAHHWPAVCFEAVGVCTLCHGSHLPRGPAQVRTAGSRLPWA